ncbi:hypothetical protein HK099_005459 [Clydaea vesicula]|uniref:Uncharacterized protein n=1 Tax=Clydaea vesicula TaxID=447962 RepID=A0AAD5U3S8_9FUNG|nr:hypothetical protein HK099_005459 [Clydaea vesicula]
MTTAVRIAALVITVVSLIPTVILVTYHLCRIGLSKKPWSMYSFHFKVSLLCIGSNFLGQTFDIIQQPFQYSIADMVNERLDNYIAVNTTRRNEIYRAIFANDGIIVLSNLTTVLFFLSGIIMIFLTIERYRSLSLTLETSKTFKVLKGLKILFSLNYVLILFTEALCTTTARFDYLGRYGVVFGLTSDFTISLFQSSVSFMALMLISVDFVLNVKMVRIALSTVSLNKSHAIIPFRRIFFSILCLIVLLDLLSLAMFALGDVDEYLHIGQSLFSLHIFLTLHLLSALYQVNQLKTINSKTKELSSAADDKSSDFSSVLNSESYKNSLVEQLVD